METMTDRHDQVVGMSDGETRISGTSRLGAPGFKMAPARRSGNYPVPRGVLAATVILTLGIGACLSSVDHRGELTVINRTTAKVIVTSGDLELEVQACDEATASDFPLNWWQVTSPGTDTFHSGGGAQGAQSYLLVTSGVPSQTDQRPEQLPPCEGLLQPGPPTDARP